MKTYPGDCVILPFQGQAIITSDESTYLRLPGERLPRRRSWRVVVMIALSASLCLRPTPTRAAVSSDEIFSATNVERTGAGLSPLRSDTRLDQAAAEKARDMIDRQYFAHVSPHGQRGWHWMNEVGYAYTEAGENLALDFVDSADVVSAWMGSRSHRKNILNEKFVDVGVAIQTGTLNDRAATIIVMLFGRQTTVTPTITHQPSVATTPSAPAHSAPPPSTGSAQFTLIDDNHTNDPQMVPSIVEAQPRALPHLTMTWQPLAQQFRRLPAPQVLGLQTTTHWSDSTELSLRTPLRLLILSTLAGLTCFLLTGVVWEMHIFPHQQHLPEPNLI